MCRHTHSLLSWCLRFSHRSRFVWHKHYYERRYGIIFTVCVRQRDFHSFLFVLFDSLVRCWSSVAFEFSKTEFWLFFLQTNWNAIAFLRVRLIVQWINIYELIRAHDFNTTLFQMNVCTYQTFSYSVRRFTFIFPFALDL